MGALNGTGTTPQQETPAAAPAVVDTKGPEPAAAPAAATQQPPAQAAPPAPPAVADTPVVEDEEAKTLLGALTGMGQEPAKWSDDSLKLFESTFGVNDPAAFKKEVEDVRGRVAVLETSEAESIKLRMLLENIERDHPVLAQAIMEASEGRDPMAYVDSIPERKLIGKEAKDISTEVLVNTYLRDKFSDAEREAMRTGNADDLGVEIDALKAKYDMFRSVAEHMHNERAGAHKSRIATREAQQKAYREKYEASLNESIAVASRDPLVRSFLTKETIAAAKKGSFVEGAIYQEDGTLTPQAIALIVKGQRYDADIKRVFDAGKKASGQKAMLEETHRMSATVPNQRSAGGGEQQQQQQPIDPAVADLIGVMAMGR